MHLEAVYFASVGAGSWKSNSNKPIETNLLYSLEKKIIKYGWPGLTNWAINQIMLWSALGIIKDQLINEHTTYENSSKDILKETQTTFLAFGQTSLMPAQNKPDSFVICTAPVISSHI